MSSYPIPLSELGRLTGRFNFNDRVALMAVNCYFDGSVGGKHNEWMTLGAFIATDRVWAYFEQRWAALLVDRYPIAPYVHMTDLITGNDPYERQAGWCNCKVQRLVDDIVSLLLELSQSGEICAFAGAVDVNARTNLLREGYTVGDPAVICAENAIGRLLTWYVKQYGVDKAYLFFDQSEPFIKSIRRRWLESKKAREPELFWKELANVQPVHMLEAPQIQICDVIAWAFTGRLRQMPDDPWANLADRLLGRPNTPIKGILTNWQITIDEKVIRDNNPRGTT